MDWLDCSPLWGGYGGDGDDNDTERKLGTLKHQANKKKKMTPLLQFKLNELREMNMIWQSQESQFASVVILNSSPLLISVTYEAEWSTLK